MATRTRTRPTIQCPLNGRCPYALDPDGVEHAQWHVSRRRSPFAQIQLMPGQSIDQRGISMTNRTTTPMLIMVYEEPMGGGGGGGAGGGNYTTTASGTFSPFPGAVFLDEAAPLGRPLSSDEQNNANNFQQMIADYMRNNRDL